MFALFRTLSSRLDRRALVLAALLAGCEEEVVEEPPPAPPPVHVDGVRREARVPSTGGTAELEPLRRATLSVEAPGRVIALDIGA